MVKLIPKSVLRITAGLGLMVCAAPSAIAQEAGEAVPDRVSARDADGVRDVLAAGGFQPEVLETGEDEAPSIQIELENWRAYVEFTDCDEAVPSFCDTLVLSTAFDRETPMSDAQVRAANLDHRYVSVLIDDEGDPYIQWAILTMDTGIDAGLFLEAVKRFSNVTDGFASVAFEGDPETAAPGE